MTMMGADLIHSAAVSNSRTSAASTSVDVPTWKDPRTAEYGGLSMIGWHWGQLISSTVMTPGHFLQP